MALHYTDNSEVQILRTQCRKSEHVDVAKRVIATAAYIRACFTIISFG